MQFSYVSSHVEEYTLTGVLSKFPDNKERPCVPKKIYWVVYRIEIRERPIAVFQCLAVRDICWTTTVMPHWHLCSHKFHIVSKSHQLLRCMGTRLDPFKVGGGGGGGTFYTLQIFALLCQNCSLFFLVVLHTFILNIGIKYN